MSTLLSPYLRFRDSAREAMAFYQSVFGGELIISTFADFQASDDPAEQDRIMHSMLTTDGGLVLMASDTPDRMGYTPGGSFAIAVSGEHADEDELRGFWGRLSDGGRVTMPLGPAAWGDTFGMCTDRFGVSWLVNIAAAAAPEPAVRR